MNATYKKGKLEFDIQELLESIHGAEKVDLVEGLACDDEIIKHVSEQIINKWTENGYSGGVFCTASDNPTRGLDWAWREVAKKSGDVAKREIERLEKALEQKSKELQRIYEEQRERGERFSI